MDVDSLTKLGGGGILGGFGVRLLWKWIAKERQEFSLYKTEVAAHAHTKQELDSERKLRKAIEMELHETRKTHEEDRKAWLAERDADRVEREDLKNRVFDLGTEVRQLRVALQERGLTA